MDIGLTGVFGSSPRRDAGFLREFAIGAEELGFASVWAPDHVVFFPRYKSKYPYSPDGSVWFRPDEGIYDPLMVCQAVAAATTTLRVGTGVLIATECHPLVTAKLVMTLDHLSGGRFELGVGSGWSSEEYAALGVPFERRGARLDEYLLAMKAAWTEEAATFDGEFVEFDDVGFSYGSVPVLEHVSLTIERGEFFGLIGPNAGGKSTLLKLMLGLLRPDSGTIRLFGEEPALGRKRVGYVPQHPTFSRRFPISVLEVVLLGMLGMRLFETAPALTWTSAALPVRALARIGRWSLIIYLVHQPLLFAVISPIAGWVNERQEVKFSQFLEQCQSTCSANGDQRFCTAYCSCALDITVRDNLWSAPAEDLTGMVKLCTQMAR